MEKTIQEYLPMICLEIILEVSHYNFIISFKFNYPFLKI